MAFSAVSTLFSLGSMPRGQNRRSANAGHQFQPPLGQPQPPVERLQPGLDLGRGDDLLRQRVGNRFETDVLIAEHQTSVVCSKRQAQPAGQNPLRIAGPGVGRKAVQGRDEHWPGR